MTKRAKTAKKKSAPALVKAATGGVTLPAVAKAAKAIPVPVILLAIGACAVGALAIFLFDATEGPRRRELIRSKALQASNSVSDIVSKGGREVKQRFAALNGRSEQRTGEQPLHA